MIVLMNLPLVRPLMLRTLTTILQAMFLVLNTGFKEKF